MIDNKRYNKKLKKIIALNEGEIFCEKCKGKGMVRDKIAPFNYLILTCDKCLGEGKLDWIERATGKQLQR